MTRSPHPTHRRRTSFAPRALLALLLLATAASGCASVEPWQRGSLASEAMDAGEPKCKRFEFANEVYREGAVGANGGKAGGGCGCT